MVEDYLGVFFFGLLAWWAYLVGVLGGADKEKTRLCLSLKSKLFAARSPPSFPLALFPNSLEILNDGEHKCRDPRLV